MEVELEEERKASKSAGAAKRKLEGDIKELAAQLDQANRVKDDSQKQLKKYQVHLKDVQRDLDEAKAAREELSAQVCTLKFDFFFLIQHLNKCNQGENYYL